MTLDPRTDLAPDPAVASFVVVVPAAGRASRFGRPKLVEPLDGEPLITATLDACLDGGAARVVLVVAPGSALPSVARAQDPRVRIVVNPDPARGMFSSILAGLRVAASDSTGAVLVLPADMPFVRATAVRTVADACQRLARPVVPMHDGRRGHPVALPLAVVRDLLDADPSSTLKSALASLAAEPVSEPVNDPGVLRDVDVPEDLRR